MTYLGFLTFAKVQSGVKCLDKAQCVYIEGSLMPQINVLTFGLSTAVSYSVCIPPVLIG